MTDQTNAQLRERIARAVWWHESGDGPWTDHLQTADAILALLSPPDTGLASVVGELEKFNAALHVDSNYFQKVFPNGVSKDRKMSVGKHDAFNYQIMRKAIAKAQRLDPFLADMLMWSVWWQCLDHQRSELLSEMVREEGEENAKLRQALTTGGSGWRDGEREMREAAAPLVRHFLSTKLAPGAEARITSEDVKRFMEVFGGPSCPKF